MRRVISAPFLIYATAGITAFSLACYSLARGIRLPSNWTYTHYLFNYEFGVVKRGIIGWLYQLTFPGQSIPYTSFAIFVTLVMIANLVCLALLIIRVILRHQHSFVILSILLFFASLAFVYFAHTIGYADHLGLLLVQLAILLRSQKIAIHLIYLLFVLFLWVHEALLVTYFPIMFVVAFRMPLNNNRLLLTWSALCLLMVVFISQLNISTESSFAMHSQAEKATGSALREDAFKVLSRDVDANIALMSSKWQKGHGERVLTSLSATLPTLFFFMTLIYLLQQHLGHERLVRTMSILACLSPLLLNVVAFDTERFACMAIINSFLILLWILDGFRHHDTSTLAYLPLVSVVKPIAIALITVNLFSDIRFISNLSSSSYPFENHRVLIHTFFDESKSFTLPNR